MTIKKMYELLDLAEKQNIEIKTISEFNKFANLNLNYN